MKGKITQLLQEVLIELGIADLEAAVVYSEQKEHGDYATSLAFKVASQLKISPLEAAEKIKEKLLSFHDESIATVEVVKPAFVNITLTAESLFKNLESIIESGIRNSSFLQGKTYLVEFTDPNPFKEFHIGHLYSNIVGESLSRIFEANGALVKRVNYQGDVGLHVAKSVWGVRQMIASLPSDEADIVTKARFLGQAYAHGATAYEESESIKSEIIEINKAVYKGIAENDTTSEIMTLYHKGKMWSLEYFEAIYHRLMEPQNDKAFDRYYFESEAGPKGLEIVKQYLAKGIFKESEGAIIFEGEEYGLHSRVFINSLGLPTYEAKELGLALTKFEEYSPDYSIMITGNEINEYFKVLLKAISLIRPDISEKTQHISHGMVRLPTGKMSSRTGDVITAESMLHEAHQKASEKIKEVKKLDEASAYTLGDDDDKIRLAEMIGDGAVKYALLKHGIGKDIEFNFEESISFEGNSGPYLQYTYVRTRSLLSKAETLSIKPVVSQGISINDEERELLRLILLYPEIVADASEKLSPNSIASYLFTLSQLFNLFYQKYPILKAESESASFKVALTQGVGMTLKEGLRLLGVKTPDKM